MVASRGKEEVKVSNLRPVTGVSTVPGDGGVENEPKSREEGRSAAHFTAPATAKMGG